MNKNYECSSPAVSDVDRDYVEIDKLGTGPTYKQRAESGDDHDNVDIDKLGTGPTSKQCAESDDDDDDYVNTKDLDNRPTSKQSTESDDDDDYVNTKDLDNQPTSKQSADVSAHTEQKVIQRAPASSNGRLKILLMILVLLLFGSLAALCALMSLYLGNVASYHTLHEQHVNATAIMKVQEHEAADLKSHLDQVQVSFERVSEQLNMSKVAERKCEVKYQQVSQLLSENQARKCEMKYQRVHERLLENKVTCEEGWRTLGLKCYFFSDNKLNWMESRDSCVKKGADLVIITSKKEQDLLSSGAKETSWIGLNDRETEGKWMWVNKQTLEETGVTFWYQKTQGKSEPDNWKIEDPMGGNCACLGHSIYKLDQWFDVSCNSKKKYICQK